MTDPAYLLGAVARRGGDLDSAVHELINEFRGGSSWFGVEAIRVMSSVVAGLYAVHSIQPRATRDG
jgi:hypothetical protein